MFPLLEVCIVFSDIASLKAEGNVLGCVRRVLRIHAAFAHIGDTAPVGGEEKIRGTAAGLIWISAVCMPIYAYTNASYFTLRSGGKTVITFLFDSCFMWVVTVPAAFVLAHFTDVSLLMMYFLVQMVDLIRCVIGYFLMKSGAWAQNLTGR